MPHVDEGTLHAYLDGELSSAERNTVETHLAECATCRASLVDERALLERASALLGAARPADRPAPPFEQLRLRRSPKRSPWHVRMPVAWAASIALALGLGYYLHEPAAPAGLMVEHLDVGEAQEEKGAPTASVLESQRLLSRAPAPAPAPRRLVVRDSVAAVADEAAKVVASEGQRADSAAAAERASLVREPTAGVAVIAPLTATPQLRNAAPAPVAQSKAQDSVVLLEGIVASGVVSRGAATVRSLPTTTSWPIINRGTARSLLGTDPVGLPGLARKIRRSPANDGTVVVEQQIDSTTTIRIFQRQNESAGFAWDSSVKAEQYQYHRSQEREIAPADRLARFVGRLRVEIAGPLSADSLNRLLDQVQPLP